MNHNARDMENKPVYGAGGFKIWSHHDKETGNAGFAYPGDDDVEDSSLDGIRLIQDEHNANSVNEIIDHDAWMRKEAEVSKGVGPFPKYGFEKEGRGFPGFKSNAPDLNSDYGSVFRNNERRETNEVSPSRGNLLVKPLSPNERRRRLLDKQSEESEGSRTGQPLNKEPLPSAPPMRPYKPGNRNAGVGWMLRGLIGQYAPSTMTTQDKDDAVRDYAENPAIPKRITSLQEQVGRYYPAESGGVAGAINKAQEAQEKNPGNLDRKRWPLQTREGIEGDQLVGYGPAEEGVRPNAAAYYQSPQTDALGIRGLSQEHTIPGISYINDANDDSFGGETDEQNSLEHELTHGSILGGPDGRTPGIGGEIRKNTGPFSPSREYKGENKDHNPSMYYGKKDLGYAMSPAEIDVRLAEVKRRYAKHTGIIVDTPEKAEQAIKWFDTTRGERKYEMGEHDSGNHELWNMLTPDQKDEILHRMPELVMDINVLEGLS